MRLLVTIVLTFAAAMISAATSAADPSTTPGSGSTYYKNCSAAAADGRYNIPRGDPAYRPALDRDGDGIACES